MITSRYCTTMAEYNSWMNKKMYALCATLTDADRKKDQRAFFRSIHSTLNHILSCDLMFIAGFTEGAAFVESEGDLYESFDELRRNREATDLRILQWSESVLPAWLQAPSTYTHFEDGVPRTVTQGFWVMHMFNHQTHHRGQITTLFTQLGHDIGSTDLHMSVPPPHAGAKPFHRADVHKRASPTCGRRSCQTLDVAPPMEDKVLASLENPYGDYCVDVFVRADGTFGFEEYRRDPEDGGVWQSLHRYSRQVFDAEEEAIAQAKSSVAWLKAGGI